ncbi:hypothetical protein OH77DRAFT_1394496 [Trametes cingulata]|nr:hypothetical protein OH77DRAFT_1394496 [Trametes cingulata]
MKAQVVSLTTEEVLSISPDIRSKFRDVVTPKRVPAEAKLQATVEDAEDEEEVVTSGAKALLNQRGVYVVKDPFECYMGAIPSEFLTVAKESLSLRAIICRIDNKVDVECVVDPGSQIVAMSEEVCHTLHIAYDPTVRLNMVSANGTQDLTLGLARNVPFSIGNITLYMQAHVVRNASYDVLLGRPFDVLTQSTVKNYSNEDQTITIRCPNSEMVATIPTIRRSGVPKFRCNHGRPDEAEGFRTSRI